MEYNGKYRLIKGGRIMKNFKMFRRLNGNAIVADLLIIKHDLGESI